MALNVLVIDDSAVMRSMIIKTLRLSGLPLEMLHEAQDGKEGLDKLLNHQIDLALVDLNMPNMNGEEMIIQARNNPETANVPILVISTECSETRIERLRSQNADFIHKPFTPETLRATVRHLTGAYDEEYEGTDTLRYRGPDF